MKRQRARLMQDWAFDVSLNANDLWAWASAESRTVDLTMHLTGRTGGRAVITLECTEACAAMPECAVCGQTKRPRGRSVPLIAENGYCGWDCPGYTQDPQPGHLWPSEWRERAKESER